MDGPELLIVKLMRGFSWFDDGLQAQMRARGWPTVTRPQSIAMIQVAKGVTRPSDIARALGLSRQAVHTTLCQMIQMGLFELAADPADARSKIVLITPAGQAMRRAAEEAMTAMAEELEARLGRAALSGLRVAFAADWGPPPRFAGEDSQAIVAR